MLLTNYCPVVNIPLLGKVLRKVKAVQLQTCLEGTDDLELFQFGFKPGHSIEIALVTLTDDI